MMRFLQKFLSYLIPGEESNISFLNWLFRLFLVIMLCMGTVIVLTNAIKDTDFGKNYGLISNQTNINTEGKISVSGVRYARILRETWQRLDFVKRQYPKSFYFSYIYEYYDGYADAFVTGLKNEDALLSFWVQPQDGYILSFDGLDEVINKRASEVKTTGFKKDECGERDLNDAFIPYLRQTLNNFDENRELLELYYCPIYKNRSGELFAVNVLYYKKLANFENLKVSFKNITKKIGNDLQIFIQ